MSTTRWATCCPVTDPEGNAGKYAYDALGRMIRYSDRAGNDWAWGYAPDGRAVRMRGPMAYGTGILRDAHGDVTRVATRHDTFHRLEYNERGDLIRLRDASGLEVRRTHTASGDLQTESDQFGRRLELTYDALGRVRHAMGARQRPPDVRARPRRPRDGGNRRRRAAT